MRCSRRIVRRIRRRICWRRRACGCRKRWRRRNRAAFGAGCRLIRRLAAAGAVLASTGFGDSDSRFAGGIADSLPDDLNGPQDLTPVTPIQPQSAKLPSPASIPLLQIQAQIRSASSTTPFPPRNAGSLNDQQVQQLLLYAARNNYNSGVRVDSVDFLAQKSE